LGLHGGRVAQRESTPFTREGSQVQSLSRPPQKPRKSRLLDGALAFPAPFGREWTANFPKSWGKIRGKCSRSVRACRTPAIDAQLARQALRQPPSRLRLPPRHSAVSGAAGPGQTLPDSIRAEWISRREAGGQAQWPTSHRYARAWVRKNSGTWDPPNFHERPCCNDVSLGRSFAGSLKRLNRDTLIDATKLIFGDAFQTRLQRTLYEIALSATA
jgi:hypothetical protein